MSRRVDACGFTLIELLVVVTILVVLLALLAPALDKAVYEAELAVCAGNLHGAAVALNAYAAQHQRQWPIRGPVRDRNRDTQQHVVSIGVITDAWGQQDYDLRPVLRDYLPINKLLVDPTCPKVDLERSKPKTTVYGTYDLWFGWQYQVGQPQKGMFKLGDRWSWDNDSFNLLISDRNVQEVNRWAISSSQDDLGVLTPKVFQDVGNFGDEAGELGLGSPTTASYWHADTDRRGKIDMNHAYDDASVDRLRNVVPQDPRTIQVPLSKQGAQWKTRTTWVWRK